MYAMIKGVYSTLAEGALSVLCPHMVIPYAFIHMVYWIAEKLYREDAILIL